MGVAPRAQWDRASQRFIDNDDPLLVWQGMLDNRYQIEVHRQESATYKGILYIFDMQEVLSGTEEQVKMMPPVLLEREVTLSYNAQFGPDNEDVLTWQDWAVEFVDAL